MSALGDLAGAAVGGIWKVAAIVLLFLWLVTGAGTGFGWWLAAHDRDVARVDLKTERDVNADLRAGIREQNRATEVLGKAKLEADAKGAAAEKLAAAQGVRFDAALAAVKAGGKATTCTEAMPAVNEMLKALK